MGKVSPAATYNSETLDGELATHLSRATNFKLFKNERVCRLLNLMENGGKISKRVENNVGKGEIARYEQFLLFPKCFQKI